MSLLLRLGALLARIEGRHWVGLGASAVLHLAVILGLRQLPPPEPAPMSFEIAIEEIKPEQAKPKPKPRYKKSHALAKAKLKQVRKHLAKPKPIQREAHTLEAEWRNEPRPRKDAPQVSLPDSRALGLPGGQPGPAGSRPRLSSASHPASLAQARPQATPEPVEPGLSEPSLPGAIASVPTTKAGESGMGLSASSQAVVLASAPGQGAQGSEAGHSLTAATSPGAEILSVSAGQGQGINALAGTGAQAVNRSEAPPQAGGEPQGIRLAAASTLSNQPILESGTTSLEPAPPATDAGLAVPAQGTGPGGAMANSQAGGAPANPLVGQSQPGDEPVGETAGPPGSLGGTSQEGPDRLRGIGRMSTSLSMVGLRSVAPSVSGQAGGTLAVAPGEPGSTPHLAVAMETVVAAPPAGKGGGSRSNKYLPGNAETAVVSEPAITSGRVRGEGGGGLSAPAASAVAASPQGTAKGSGGMAVAAPATPAGIARSGSEPARLETIKTAAVEVMRPDSKAQALDVLAPSTYCPLPGHSFPDNRPPKPEGDDTQKPGYAQDNPSFFYPIQAWAYNVQGKVVVRVEVQPDGRPGKMWLKQSSGNGILDLDAQSQLSRWRFIPARRNGEAVTAWIDIPVVYRLNEAKR